MVSLTSGYHPQSNSQTERLNQGLVIGLRCLVSQNPATWSRHLIWVEYAHSTLPCSSSSLSPFQCAYSFQLPLFPVLKGEVSIPSVQVLIRCGLGAIKCWSKSARTKRAADRRIIPSPSYRSGQMVWLSSKDLPLRVESSKLALRFVGPFPTAKVVNPAVVRLKLPCSQGQASESEPSGPSLQTPTTPPVHRWWSGFLCEAPSGSLMAGP